MTNMMKIKSKHFIGFMLIITCLSSILLIKLDQSNSNEKLFQVTRPRSSSLTRSGPINVLYDGNYSAYADSGDGSPGNPWIIQDKLIEMNYTESGIVLIYNIEHVIFRNIFVNECIGDGKYFDRQFCFIAAFSSNIQIENCTFSYSEIDMLFLGCTNIKMTNIFTEENLAHCLLGACENVTVDDFKAHNHLVEGLVGIAIDGCNNTLIKGLCTQDLTIGIITGIDLVDVMNVNLTIDSMNYTSPVDSGNPLVLNNITNTRILNCKMLESGGSSYSGIAIDNCTGMIIRNTTINGFSVSIVSNGSVPVSTDNILIENCTFMNPRIYTIQAYETHGYDNWTIQDCYFNSSNAYDFWIGYFNNTIIKNNFFNSGFGTNMYNCVNFTFENNVMKDYYAGLITNTFTNFSIKNNIFQDIEITGIDTIYDTNGLISNNHFTRIGIGNYGYGQNGLSTNVTWKNNYYDLYFDENPFDICEYESNITLPSNFTVYSGAFPVIDESPLYDPNMFNRSESITIRLSKTSNYYAEIKPTDLRVYLNHVLIGASANPDHVLYRVQVHDQYFNYLLLDEYYNLNETQDLDIQLQVNVLAIMNRKGSDCEISITFKGNGGITSLNILSNERIDLVIPEGKYTYVVHDKFGKKIMEGDVDLTERNQRIVIEDQPPIELPIYAIILDPVTITLIGISIPVTLLTIWYFNKRLPKGKRFIKPRKK